MTRLGSLAWACAAAILPAPREYFAKPGVVSDTVPGRWEVGEPPSLRIDPGSPPRVLSALRAPIKLQRVWPVHEASGACRVSANRAYLVIGVRFALSRTQKTEN